MPKEETISGSCTNITVTMVDINCDPSAPSIGLCKGGKPNAKLQEIRFDGRGSCNDVSFAVDMRYGTNVVELEEFCSGNGVRRRLASPAGTLATYVPSWFNPIFIWVHVYGHSCTTNVGCQFR
jgi:hypothetical protein